MVIDSMTKVLESEKTKKKGGKTKKQLTMKQKTITEDQMSHLGKVSQLVF